MIEEYLNIPISVNVGSGWQIRNHPVQLGVPFPRGAIKNLAQLQLY
jgi:hypothetical protein